MRTLEQSLARAESLRDFRKANSDAFQKSADFVHIVNLADEVLRLREGIACGAQMLINKAEEDHTESW
jgi:hypothetical protein